MTPPASPGRRPANRIRRISAAQKDIRRLDITVHDIVFVSDRERAGDAPGELQRLFFRERAALQAHSQIFALQPLHDQIRIFERRYTV